MPRRSAPLKNAVKVNARVKGEIFVYKNRSLMNSYRERLFIYVFSIRFRKLREEEAKRKKEREEQKKAEEVPKVPNSNSVHIDNTEQVIRFLG